MALACDEEAIEIAIFSHYYPNLDEAAQTQLFFEYLISLVPPSVKRRMGYHAKDEQSEESRQAELDRLDNYTNFGTRKYGSLDKDDFVPEWELPEGEVYIGSDDFPGIKFDTATPKRSRQVADITFADETDPDTAGMERIS